VGNKHSNSTHVNPVAAKNSRGLSFNLSQLSMR
jgi:hypothetical protein